jgi:hypothetical protein
MLFQRYTPSPITVCMYLNLNVSLSITSLRRRVRQDTAPGFFATMYMSITLASSDLIRFKMKLRIMKEETLDIISYNGYNCIYISMVSFDGLLHYASLTKQSRHDEDTFCFTTDCHRVMLSLADRFKLSKIVYTFISDFRFLFVHIMLTSATWKISEPLAGCH